MTIRCTSSSTSTRSGPSKEQEVTAAAAAAAAPPPSFTATFSVRRFFAAASSSCVIFLCTFQLLFSSRNNLTPFEPTSVSTVDILNVSTIRKEAGAAESGISAIPAANKESFKNSTTIKGKENEPEWCNLVDANQTRASRQHWDLHAGAELDIYELDEYTSGVALRFTSSVPREEAQQKFNHKSLLKGKIRKLVPRDDRSAPTYESLLGCGPGQAPHGTAVVVVQNFIAPNLWHALCVQQGTMQLLRSANITSVDYFIFGGKVIQPTALENSSMLYEIICSLFTPQVDAGGKLSSPYPCLERILWIETRGYRPGSFWQLNLPGQDARQCTSHLSERIQSYNRDYLEAIHPAFSVLDGDDMNMSNAAAASTGNPSKKKELFCYMSRAKRENRVRHFAPDLEIQFDLALHAWAANFSEAVVLYDLQFDGSETMLEQISRVANCDVLFGPHGAGLTHQWFVDAKRRVFHQNKAPLLVIEWDVNTCKGYYGNMAYWLGHRYHCFTKEVKYNNPMKEVFSGFDIPSFLSLLSNVSRLRALTRFDPFFDDNSPG